MIEKIQDGVRENVMWSCIRPGAIVVVVGQVSSRRGPFRKGDAMASHYVRHLVDPASI